MEKIKVCHVTSVHNRYDTRIFIKECVSLAKKYHTTLLVIDGGVNEKKDGVEIVSINHTFKNRYDRILHSSKILLDKAIEIDAQIYHLHDPELLSLGVKLQKRGKKVIFDSHEDYALNISEKTWLVKPIRKIVCTMYKQKEKRILKKFSAVISVTPSIVERLKKINENTVMITNFPTQISCEKRTFSRTICFAGGIVPHYMHDKIIEAISEIDNITYKIAGKIDKNYLEYLKTVKGFEKVEFLGMLNYDSVCQLYEKSAVGMVVCNYKKALGFKRGTMGILKFFEYIAMGLPMVATDFELWKPIVENEGNPLGVTVCPTDVLQIREGIEKLLEKSFNDTCSLNCTNV